VNEPLRQLAMRLLARRDHSCAELEQKLSRAGGSTAEVAAAIGQLKESGLQSDARFAESYVRAHSARQGAARMRHDLRGKGVATEVIDACLANSELPDELERARGVWQRKFGELPANAKAWAQQARFLQGRGFAAETIRRLLKAAREDE
jgi:regulatory protein